MVLTKVMIDGLRVAGRMDIDCELEDLLLRRFGTEPHPHEYSEQDLHEQVRKSVILYQREKGVIHSDF
jgi:hypothetical protein